MSEKALLAAILASISGLSPVESLRSVERKKGVEAGIGSVLLPDADWHKDTVVTLCPNSIRLVLLVAKEANKGALTRLLAWLDINEKRRVEVIEPTTALAATLAKRGWIKKTRGNCFQSRENYMVLKS